MFDTIRSINAPSIPQPIGFREWVRDHDERWSFVILYLGLAVGLSVFVSLFWLLVVGALHFVLEYGRQSIYRTSRAEVIGHALWEVKLDVGLVLLALMLVLYIEVVLGLLGLQSAARAAAVTRTGARLGTRAAAWERNIRTFLLTVDEMARIAYAAWLVRKGGPGAQRAAQAETEAAASGEVAAEAASSGEAQATMVEAVDAIDVPEPPEPPEQKVAVSGPQPPSEGWRGPWGIGDRIGLLLVVSGIVLMLAAPWLTIHDWSSALATIMEELRPFP